MGGDEFCALFARATRSRDPIIAGAAAALSEHGEGFSIGCSYGAIVLPREAQDAAEALRIADQRMYAQKNAGRTSAAPPEQGRAAARARRAQPRACGTHLDGVADLAEATAAALGLATTRSSRSATPPSCTTSARSRSRTRSSPSRGRSTDDEWEFIRRHTADRRADHRRRARARARGRALVRSSHERWDGAGYPDRLAGRADPARRAHRRGRRRVRRDDLRAPVQRRALAPSAALDELRRCAGTQFDPVVVDAFCAAWAEQNASTTTGSNWVLAHRRSSLSADAGATAGE